VLAVRLCLQFAFALMIVIGFVVCLSVVQADEPPPSAAATTEAKESR
jgi:hypothetical protein